MSPHWTASKFGVVAWSLGNFERVGSGLGYEAVAERPVHGGDVVFYFDTFSSQVLREDGDLVGFGVP